jgi:hypothetical protein
MGRKAETGYKNQLYILGVLRDFGPLYGQQIVNKTGLKREEVWRNLRALTRKQILNKTKTGRVVYYKPNVNKETLEYIISILYEGGLKKMAAQARKLRTQARKQYSKLKSVAKATDEYEDEIIEMSDTPYIEALENAKKWRATKKEHMRVEMQESLVLTSRQKKQNRELLKTPAKFQTKQITTSSGLTVKIRRPTLFEISAMIKEIRDNSEKSHLIDPNLEEAIRRLLA